MRRLSFIASLSIALIAQQTLVSAEAVSTSAGARSTSSQEARRHHRAGVEAFAQGRYDDAVTAFLAANSVQPSAASSFNVARACEARRDDACALALYREYLRRAPGAADRPAVNQKVARLAKRVGEQGVQQVTFLAVPPAAVSLDSEPIGVTPITLEVRPGTHDVEFRKAGFEPSRFTFELPHDRPLDVVAKLATARGQGREIARSEDAEEADRAAAPGGAMKRAPRRGSVTRTVGFAALGASVAALGGAVTLELMRRDAEEEARQQPGQAGFSEAYERMKSRQTMARVFAGAGGALAALGGVLLVIASGENERTERSGLAFGCAPTRCQAAYRGAF